MAEPDNAGGPAVEAAAKAEGAGQDSGGQNNGGAGNGNGNIDTGSHDRGLIRHHVTPMIRKLRRRAGWARAVAFVMVGLLVFAIGIAGYWFVVIGDREIQVQRKQEAAERVEISRIEDEYNASLLIQTRFAPSVELAYEKETLALVTKSLRGISSDDSAEVKRISDYLFNVDENYSNFGEVPPFARMNVIEDGRSLLLAISRLRIRELEKRAAALGYVKEERPQKAGDPTRPAPPPPPEYDFVQPGQGTVPVRRQGTLPNGEPDIGKTLAESAPELANRITLVVGLFIVLQLLISIFRYNMRLAAFYDARADALQLGGAASETTFERLVQVLSPDAYDFGKAPKTPADQAVEIAKMIVSRSKSGGG